MADSTNHPEGASWDNYWQGALGAAAFSSGGVNHPVLDQFWRSFFQNAPKASTAIDIASGNGAVIEAACSFYGDTVPRFTCLDISEAALDAIQQRFSNVTPVVADARSTGLSDATFDLVTSQFGVEYAGAEAILEAARLVAADGWLGLVMHCRHGGIFQECRAAQQAVERLQASEFLPKAIAMFEAGFAACQGADRAPYDAAAMRFAPSVGELEAIMSDHGPHVAGGTLLQLHENVDRFHRRMPHYAPQDVLGWLRRMDGELTAYALRMRSMREAALGRADFDSSCEALRQQGFDIERSGELMLDAAHQPLAWMLVANRAGAS